MAVRAVVLLLTVSTTSTLTRLADSPTVGLVPATQRRLRKTLWTTLQRDRPELSIQSEKVPVALLLRTAKKFI